MEEVDKVSEQASERSVLSGNLESKNRVSTLEEEEDPSVEVNKEAWEEEEEEEDEITPPRINNLQRNLTMLVTNIQTTADARESLRREELEEARKIRLQRLENDAKSSQEKFEEITSGCLIAKEKVIPQELQKSLNSQRQLCAVILDDKKKLINELQQELKAVDDRYVKDLKRQEEELDMVMERMEEQIKTLTKAYREELAQIGRVYQQESEVFLTKDRTGWEQYMKELGEKELERLAQRKKKVAEYEAIIHSLMLETMDKHSIVQIEQNAKFQVLEREHQQMQATNMITKLKQIKQKNEVEAYNFNLAHMNSRIVSLQAELNTLVTKCTSQEKQFRKTTGYLSKDYKHNIQQYERVQKKMKHFAVVNARKFEEMWLMIEAEVKQLVERALVIDSLICKKHLSLAWERPLMARTNLCLPIQAGAHQADSQLFQTGQVSQCSQGMVDTSDGPRPEAGTECTDVEMCKEGAVSLGNSDTQVEEEGKTLGRVMELLCDEVGFLMGDKPLIHLTPQQREKQTAMKLGSFLHSCGIEEEDMPKLAYFFFKYEQQQREMTEDVCGESGESHDQAEAADTSSSSHLTSDFIHPNNVLPALKSFLAQHTRARESSGCRKSSFPQVQGPDNSADKAYWKNMGNIISEDKVRLWEAAEDILKKYLLVLTEMSELVPETENLRQQNTELRLLLQRSLS